VSVVAKKFCVEVRNRPKRFDKLKPEPGPTTESKFFAKCFIIRAACFAQPINTNYDIELCHRAPAQYRPVGGGCDTLSLCRHSFPRYSKLRSWNIRF